MIKSALKRKLIQFVEFNFLPRIEALQNEIIYQGIFSQQCLKASVCNDFYPVGAAASYSLMYLLFRIVRELPVRNITELGSGQTTILIDNIKASSCLHIAYENHPGWVEYLHPKLSDCDYRQRDLVANDYNGILYQGYKDLNIEPFDLLLVDGPNGTDSFSRFSCIPLIEANLEHEFVLIFDDASRPGEQETIGYLKNLLNRKQVDFKLNYLHGRTCQALITTPRFRAASYFFKSNIKRTVPISLI